jgi:cell division septum initiation protein DivIVA
VALDRQSIEKTDFPVGQRGYDPEVVDAHLSALADEIDEYKRAARQRTETLALSASDRVRAIVEAAESSAAEIQRAAEEEAREIREEATNEVRIAREQASEQAREYVGRVSDSANAMLERIGAMEHELSGLIESLRMGSNRLNADLQQLQSDLVNVGEVVGPRPRFEPEAAMTTEAPMPTETPMPTEAPAGGFAADTAAYPQPGSENGASHSEGPVPEAAEFQEVIGDPGQGSEGDAAAASSSHADDAEGARLIALNMALNGTPREETGRYLSENFQLADAGGLLDEVYASVDG